MYKDSMESLILACDGGNIPQAVIDCFYEVIPFFSCFQHKLAIIISLAVLLFYATVSQICDFIFRINCIVTMFILGLMLLA